MFENRSTPLILVASHDADARRICEAALRHAGYAVLRVDDPDRVLDEARRARPDLLITSHPTTTTRGRCLTEEVRADALLTSIPILSLASWVRPEELAEAQATGVTESIAMPASPEAVIGAVHRLLDAPSPNRARTHRSRAGPRASLGRRDREGGS